MKGTWEEEEKCPRTSPLTFNRITRPSVDMGKKKMQEMEEDSDGRENEKAIVVSLVKKKKEKRRKGA